MKGRKEGGKDRRRCSGGRRREESGLSWKEREGVKETKDGEGQELGFSFCSTDVMNNPFFLVCMCVCVAVVVRVLRKSTINSFIYLF